MAFLGLFEMLGFQATVFWWAVLITIVAILLRVFINLPGKIDDYIIGFVSMGALILWAVWAISRFAEDLLQAIWNDPIYKWIAIVFVVLLLAIIFIPTKNKKKVMIANKIPDVETVGRAVKKISIKGR